MVRGKLAARRLGTIALLPSHAGVGRRVIRTALVGEPWVHPGHASSATSPRLARYEASQLRSPEYRREYARCACSHLQFGLRRPDTARSELIGANARRRR